MHFKSVAYFCVLFYAVNAQLLALPCDKTDCNNHGSCLGTKTAPLCFCELGFSGLRCDQSQCDSKLACSGNGICIGNNVQNSCICNLGYTGLRCENSPTSGNDLFGLFSNWLGSGTDPMGSLPSIFGNNGISQLGLNNLFKSLSTANLPSTNTNPGINPLNGGPVLAQQPSEIKNIIEPLEPMLQPPQQQQQQQVQSRENVFPHFSQTNDAIVIGKAVDNGPALAHFIPQYLPIAAANFSLPLNQGLDVCGAQDCNNQGVCIGSKTLPVCLCYVGFTGTKCETNVFDNLNVGDSGHSIICSASDCNNNGVCIGTKGSFTCACKLGFAGRRCESTPYPLCDASDCNNNGLCIGTKGAFTCACHLGFSGERCERAQGTLCEISDCNTQGICLGTKDQFTCLCNIGYTGKRCESRVLDTVAPLAGGLFCELKDCSNNGLCVGTKLLPTCLCNLGYLGLRCEIEPLCFSPLQCTGNGLCLGTAKNFICACNLGWSGPNCQYFSG